VKFWTPKFVIALGALAVLTLDSCWYTWFPGSAPTPEAKNLFLPFMKTSLGSFVFLLVVLYVLSHAGGWVFARLRRRGDGEAEETRGRKPRKP
jgi:hypothetical protein